jgi:type I restriction enzyme, S subunit
VGNRNIPEIRFSGFAGEWEQCTLHSMVDRVKSYSLSRDVETSKYTGYKYIHYGDIHTKVADIIDECSDLPNIKAGNYELLEKGDLVLADASEDYKGIAAPAVVTIDVPYKLVSGLHTIALRPKQVDSMFLYYLINSPIFRKYGYKTGTGMKVFGISATNLLKFESLFPVLEEQTKIGNFFKQLDDTIALHQQELTTLKQTKQGFLQKMFPKEGESVPEVRFPGFTGEWEERKLEDLLESAYQGINTAGDKVEYSDSGVKVLQSKHITSGTISFDDARYLDKERYSEYFPKYVPAVDDILFANIGTIGPSTVVTDSKEFLVAWNILKMTPSNEANSRFIQLQLQRLNSQRYFEKVTTGNATKFVNKDEMLGTQIVVPEKKEQFKISDFFANLDHIIAFHQRELDALKATKKAFLQKMFV